MPIRVYWDENDPTIARWDMEGTWAWTEFFEAQVDFHAKIKELSHEVDVIADFRTSKMVPGDAFVNFRRAQRTQMPNRRHIVFVGAGGFVNTMAQTFDRVMLRHSRWHMFTVDSLEEAYKVLERQRSQ